MNSCHRAIHGVPHAPAPGEPRDQALGLRALARSVLARTALPEEPRRSPVVAVCSGKGGVGKSVVATNLSIVLAQRGLWPVLIDADAGTPNADILLGLSPGRRLGVGRDPASDPKALVSSSHGGLRFIAGPTDPDAYRGCSVQRLTQAVSGLDPQPGVIVLDIGAGIGASVREPASAADLVLVVMTPDPTSIADAYALIKAIHLGGAAGGGGARPIVAAVVNQAGNEDEASRCHHRLSQCAERFLGLRVESFGWLPLCPSVRESVRDRCPVVVGSRTSQSAEAIRILSVCLAKRLKTSDNYSQWWCRAARYLRDKGWTGQSRHVKAR